MKLSVLKKIAHLFYQAKWKSEHALQSLILPVRASNFFRLNAAALLGELLLSQLSSLLMQTSLWLPVLLGLGGILVDLVVVLTLLPETVTLQKHIQRSVSSLDDNPELDCPGKNFWRDIKGDLISRLKNLRFIWASPQLVLLGVVFSVANLYRSSAEFLLQYVSRRYGWSIAQAGFLLSYRAGMNLILFVAFLPGISYLLLKYRYCDAQTKDLWLARASTVSMALGTLATGFAPQAPLMVIGDYTPSIR